MSAEIDKIGKMATHRRGDAIVDLRHHLHVDLRADLCRYRQVVRSLRWRREHQGPMTLAQEMFSEPNMAVSLKHNHLWGGFANLHHLASLKVEFQMKLF